MTPTRGCIYKEGSCFTIVEQCKGCDRIIEYNGAEYCFTYPEPAMRWVNLGGCPFCSTRKSIVKVEKFVNPLKASKKKVKPKK
jgi:hypothetical protein